MTTFEYFQKLQLEYIVTQLRLRIYRAKTDKEFYARALQGKKLKIEEIGIKNRIPTIFTDKDLFESFEKKIYRDGTYPLFYYRDAEHKIVQEPLDLLFYYYRGTEVRFLEEETVKVGVVQNYEIGRDSLTLKEDGLVKRVNLNNCQRIL